MSNTKFKSGDKVVFRKSSLESGMIDAKEGDVFTVHTAGVIHVFLEELDGVYHVTHFEHYVEKEKVMQKYIPEVGDKVKGFKFEAGTDSVGYDTEMDDYVEEIGVVVDVYTDSFVVQFPDSLEWMYPASLSHLAKIENASQIEQSPKEIPQQDSQIDWQVGQEVWDVLHGKGCVTSVATTGVFWVYVDFGRVARLYNKYGVVESYPHEHMNRSLFFSEPKIIAETKPPKKPFTPVFKQGDTIVVKWADTTQVLILEKETEWQVKGMNGEVWDKDPDVHFYKLGEQVKFS